MKHDKKKAAAISAVVQYIKTEEETLAAQLAAVSINSMESALPDIAVIPPALSVNVWGASGRSTQMQMRSLMQMKAFHNLRR